jgi:hypothetical protein
VTIEGSDPTQMYALVIPDKGGGYEYVPKVIDEQTVQYTFTLTEIVEMKQIYIEKLKGLLIRTSDKARQGELLSMLEGVRIIPHREM